MHYHNPRASIVGPITIHVSGFLCFEKRTYPNLPSAVWNVGTRNLSFSADAPYVIDDGGYFGPRRKIWFYDGCGDLISPAVVKVVADEIRGRRVFRFRRYAKEHVSEDHFRRLPVPNINKPKLRRSWDRHIRTTQERRLNLEVKDDEICSDLGIRIRGRRAKLPSVYDDIPHARRGDNWKNYRKTRWK